MTTYVDTSTLIKLMATEAGSAVATTIWESAPSLAAVSLIEVEAVAALAAAHRQARLTDDELADAYGADVFTSADSALCNAAASEGMLVANPLDR